MLRRHDEFDLIWYFSIACLMFAPSARGAMLEGAKALAFDSRGMPIPPPDRANMNIVPIKHESHEPSYTPDDAALIRVADVSRKLRALAPAHAAALEAYY